MVILPGDNLFNTGRTPSVIHPNAHTVSPLYTQRLMVRCRNQNAQWNLVKSRDALRVDIWVLSMLIVNSWWRHQRETFSALLAICAGNSTVPGEFPAQRPVTRSFDVFFDWHPNKRSSKQCWGWWFETPPCPLWRHRNVSHRLCPLAI